MDQRALQRRAYFRRKTARHECQYGKQAPVLDVPSASGRADFGLDGAVVTGFVWCIGAHVLVPVVDLGLITCFLAYFIAQVRQRFVSQCIRRGVDTKHCTHAALRTHAGYVGAVKYGYPN
jgi:hypothetical protein